jgi:chromosome segregation ATPase
MTDITGRPAPRLAEFAPPKYRSPPAAPLPDTHQHDFEAHMREHFAIAAERDALRKEVADLKTELAASKAANMMMESNVNASESRVASYQAERDQAVAERAKWEALFVSIQAQLLAFIPPTLPIVKEAAKPFEAD